MTVLHYLIYFLICSFSFCAASPINDDEQRVIMRTWYSQPIKKKLDDSYDPPESIGHISLEIPSRKAYLSLWPDECCLVANPVMQPIKALFTQSYYRDIIQMGRSADSIICLYKLNVDKLSGAIEVFKQKTSHWMLLSDPIVNEQENSQKHNCATIVFSSLLNVLFERDLDTESYLGGIHQLNDTFFDAQTRLDILNEFSKSWVFADEYGLNYESWQECIKQGKILSPYPKISLLKKPDIVTPCTVNLWTRNLRERERKSFMLDLIPAYTEKGKIEVTNYSFTGREEGVDDWSLRSPLRLVGRSLHPWSKSYFSEQVVATVGSYFILGLLANYQQSPIFIVPVSFFLTSGVNFMHKIFHRELYLYQPSRKVSAINY